MDIVKLKIVASDYMKVWNANEDNRLDLYAGPDIAVHYTHFEKELRGIEAYRKVLRMTYNYFPDIAIDIKNIIACNDAVTVYWQYTGTHRHGNLFGAEARGKKVIVPGISILEMKGDKVVREYGIVDNLSLAMQVGAMNVQPT